MNIWNHPYPNDIKVLINRAEQIAESVKAELQKKDCPTLNDFYYENNKERYLDRNKFVQHGYHPNSKPVGKSQTPTELSGLYIFGVKEGTKTTPVYIGISRTIFRRLKQHGWGKGHNECTLAYLLANEEKYKSGFSKTRDQMPQKHLQQAREKIQSYKVVLYPIDLHPVEDYYSLYFLEIALAGLLKTKWNKFKTH